MHLSRIFLTSAMSAVLLLAAPLAASAESLAGQVGNKRYPVNFNNVTGNCIDAYKAYVAASGHSAYAATPRSGNFVCGIALNARSEEAAQQRAIADCQGALKRFKIDAKGRCILYISK